MRLLPLACALLGCLLAEPAHAEAPGADAGTEALAASLSDNKPRGQPKIELDQLELPEGTPNARQLKKQLREFLRREVRRADWGAGREAKITYRFFVTDLDVREEDGVLRVTCRAVGRLPKGKTAKGSLSYGGNPRERNAVVSKVLQIVARGVITRLAELERIRRGDLDPSGVRSPVAVD